MGLNLYTDKRSSDFHAKKTILKQISQHTQSNFILSTSVFTTHFIVFKGSIPYTPFVGP